MCMLLYIVQIYMHCPQDDAQLTNIRLGLKCLPQTNTLAYFTVESMMEKKKFYDLTARLTVDPEGNLWFSNVTRKDASEDFLYACSAASYFRNEYKLGNRVHMQVIQSGSSSGLQVSLHKKRVVVQNKSY